MTKKIRIVLLLIASALISESAFAEVSNARLEKHTAFALGLDKEDFTIHNREQDGLRTWYSVDTKSGQRFTCYVAGQDEAVSDAICNEIGKTTTCNALLKAAGKCPQ